MPTRTLWVETRDPRGRLFHRPTEIVVEKGLWGVLPGTWIGFDTGHGIVPMRNATELRDGESPTFTYMPDQWTAVHGAPGIGCYVLLDKDVNHDCDVDAVLARHGADERCAHCGGRRGDHHWTVDARTVGEPIYCDQCREWFERVIITSRPRFQEMDCACGTWCYIRVRPRATERGLRHDVLLCAACKALKCADCLPDGETTCRDCLTKRRAA